MGGSADVTHRDRFPGQRLGLAASLIPFIQHNELNRAMMGAKNMKQAVPLIRPEQPLVKTGFEEIVARLSGRGVWSRTDGRVVEASAEKIVISTPDGSQDIYPLQPYSPTSTHTCFVQRPIVKPRDAVNAGQLIADGAAMRGGELTLGTDVLVAYMPWEGYNFEDAIVISERLVRDDVLTSLHVVELRPYRIYADERVETGALRSEELRAHNLCGPGDPFIARNLHSGRGSRGSCSKARMIGKPSSNSSRSPMSAARFNASVGKHSSSTAGLADPSRIPSPLAIST